MRFHKLMKTTVIPRVISNVRGSAMVKKHFALYYPIHNSRYMAFGKDEDERYCMRMTALTPFISGCCLSYSPSLFYVP